MDLVKKVYINLIVALFKVKVGDGMEGRKKISDKNFKAIQDLVYDNIGVNLTEKKRALVISRLSKRLRELGLNDFGSYIDYLKENEAELEVMFNLITTNVTRFFREQHHFDYLKEKYFPCVLKEAKKNNRPKKLRIWSSACSTGEEPYSLAILAHNFFEDKDWEIEILASDINTEVLKIAQKGIYIKEKVKKIPYELLKKYFRLGTGDNQGLFKVKKKLQKLIKFRQLNLTAKKPYPIEKPLDIIFCRNVFIYFNKQTQNYILDKFYNNLIDSGLLFMGHSEKIDIINRQQKKWKMLEPTIYQRAD